MIRTGDEMKQPLERVVVIGTSGSGKTHLAQRLAAVLGVDHIELDALHWGPNWTEAEPEAFRADVAEALSESRWVVDGNYSTVRDITWGGATHLIWLNFGFPVIFGRMLRRTLGRMISGEELWAGNRESWRTLFSSDSMLLWVIKTYPRRRREYPALLCGDEFSHLEVLEFGAPRDTELFMRGVEARFESRA